MNQGKFIVVEGIEGAGKSSAIAIIQSILTQHQISFINTREPGGTPLAEQLRTIVKAVHHDEVITPECELLLMYASRSQLIHNRIKPALLRGDWVLGDQHDLSSRAYQGGGRAFTDETIDAIANVTLQGFKPDLTLYLDIDPEIGLTRAKNRGELDRIELEKLDFFHRVRAKYQTIAASDDSIVTIDASLPMDAVHHNISNAIKYFIDEAAQCTP